MNNGSRRSNRAEEGVAPEGALASGRESAMIFQMKDDLPGP
jgi:hypothetical protein